MPDHTLETPTDSVTREIVDAVADTTGHDPDTLPPLYDVIDPDALNTLMNRPRNVGQENADVEVTFTFADAAVTVSSTDGVDVSAGNDNDRPDLTSPAVDD